MRTSTIAEFNKDGEYMTGIKAMYLTAEARWRDKPSDRKRKFADTVLSYAQDESKRLRKKHFN